MSKHNYSQYSNKKRERRVTDDTGEVVNRPAPVEEVKQVVHNPEPVVKMAEETVTTVTLPEMLEGVVVGCAKLNVRVAPSATADVACILDAMSELAVDVANSNNEWVKVCTATGVEGYCMRKFIDVHM